MNVTRLPSFAYLFLAGVLTACGNSQLPGDQALPGTAAKLSRICPGETATADALKAFFNAGEGDVIEFCEGTFEFTTGLVLGNTRGVTIRGAGIDKTILNFANSNSKEGIFASHTQGLTVEDLTIQDTAGDGLKVSDSRFVTMRRVKVTWTNVEEGHPNYDASQESWARNGAYAFYPVLTSDVLIEDCIARGSSDVGFYVGQSQRVIVRNNVAEWNVQGYEFENTDDSEMHDNLATNNAGGFLAVDLPGRTRYGDKNRFYNNRIINNNIDNFAPRGTIAAAVPRGTGMIILATDQVEVFNNEFRDNKTLGLVIVNYGLVDSSKDPRYDYYAEGIHIHDNLFADNGTQPQEPVIDPATVLADPNSLTGNPSLLPSLIMAKNQGQTGHIAWDGAFDSLNPDCQYPQGVPADERGKPQYQDDDRAPDCGETDNGNPIKYNAYKFDGNGKLRKPDNWICIHDNTFADTLVPQPQFVNFHGTDPELATRDKESHACSLPALPITPELSYTPGGGGGADGLSEAETRRLCNGGSPRQVNWAAAAADCPTLDQYGLFADPQDPRSAPNGGGVPFDLTTPLFSDYALKYRVAFMPPGTSAQWQDASQGPNAAIRFPVGTILAKTFAFRDGSEENVVETRLLIKRQGSEGVIWEGLPYIWRTDPASGRRIAELKVEGGEAAVSWNFDDPDSRVETRYTGSTDAYVIPHAAQCVTCHQRQEIGEAGASPIGPKPRMLNRDYDYGASLGIRNQLVYWCSTGLLQGCPNDVAQAERLPEWNVPGSSGFDPDSDQDLEARARAYLEINCAHCHNPKGTAKSTRMNLDQWILRESGEVEPRPVDRDYGICKSPVASGRGTGDRLYDIVPGDPDNSIMDFRLNDADDAAIRMPPIARSVRHDEGYALIRQWIDRLPMESTQDDNCSTPVGGLPVVLP